jgi:sigma-B regulation protein RsbU (phosphoserine phosphatase)
MRDLNALLELSDAMAKDIHLDQLLLTIVRKTTEVMEADRSSLFLYDKEKNQLWSKIAEGLEIKELRFPVGIGIAGDVAKTRRPTNIPDAYEDPRFNKAFDMKTGYRTRSVLCLPISNKEGELVGVIQCLNKKGGGPFDAHDERLLATLGAHAAVALERARLVEAYLEKQRMEEALKVAQNIQMSLLPTESPPVKGFDIYGLTVACDETGGDYFDYIDFPDGKIGLVIGDVSGHGLGAAMYMATSRAALRSIIMSTQDPAQVLHMVNNRLAWDMTDEAFITLFFALLDPATRQLRYTSAGHEDPVVYRAAGKSFDVLPSTGMPLGMMDGMDFPEGQMTILNEGDILLLTTDGVFEADDVHEQQFGHDRMKKVLTDLGNRPAKEIAEELKKRTFEWIGEGTVRDDVTIVVIKGVPVVQAEAQAGGEELQILEEPVATLEPVGELEVVEEVQELAEVKEVADGEEITELKLAEGEEEVVDLKLLEE